MARVAVSMVMLAAVTVVFTVVEGWAAQWFGWTARIEIMPLALAGAGTTLAFWFGATLLLGRVYCSWMCPMGAVQDCFAHMRRMTRRMKARHPYRWSEGKNRFRYALLMVVVASAVAGVPLLLSLSDPYSAYGRVASEMLLPVKQWVTGDPVALGSWMALAIAAATLAAVGITACLRGRLVCNTVCPVGSTLSVLSRYALFHFDIDTDVCVNCRKCERACKSECINMADHVVDGSRCVACFNCVDVCDHKAISYTFRRKKLSLPLMQPVNTAAAAPTVKADATGGRGGCDRQADRAVKVDRRQFLATGLIVAAAPALSVAAKGKQRIKAISNPGKALAVKRAVAPPGRRSMGEFLERCTGCGLCVARCPAKVLRPSTDEFGWLNMLHPVMDFDKSYCRYNCTRCSDVCPTGALLPLTEEEKHIFIIGHARVVAENCIGCGLCASRCPRKAIVMAARKPGQGGGSPLTAQVDTDLCIGCGACQYICPATPEKAIGVEGIS